MILPPNIQPSDILTFEIMDWDAVGAHDSMGSAHAELAGLVAGQPRMMTLPVFSKKGTLQVENVILIFYYYYFYSPFFFFEG